MVFTAFKIVFLAILSYFIVILETSLIPHIYIFGYCLSFVSLVVILWNSLEERKKINGIILAVFSGFFTDIFSTSLIGINVVVFLAIALLIKYVIKKHARLPISNVSAPAKIFSV